MVITVFDFGRAHTKTRISKILTYFPLCFQSLMVIPSQKYNSYLQKAYKWK